MKTFQINDKVCWRTVNGTVEGVLTEKLGNGDWYALLPNGKYMLINEERFL